MPFSKLLLCQHGEATVPSYSKSTNLGVARKVFCCHNYNLYPLTLSVRDYPRESGWTCFNQQWPSKQLSFPNEEILSGQQPQLMPERQSLPQGVGTCLVSCVLLSVLWLCFWVELELTRYPIREAVPDTFITNNVTQSLGPNSSACSYYRPAKTSAARETRVLCALSRCPAAVNCTVGATRGFAVQLYFFFLVPGLFLWKKVSSGLEYRKIVLCVYFFGRSNDAAVHLICSSP